MESQLIVNEFQQIGEKFYVPVEAIIECFNLSTSFNFMDNSNVVNQRIIGFVLSAVGKNGIKTTGTNYKEQEVVYYPQCACMAGNVEEVIRISKNKFSEPREIRSIVKSSVKICLEWKRIECLRALTFYESWEFAVEDFFKEATPESVQNIPQEYFKILTSKGLPNEALSKINSEQFSILLNENILTLDNWKHAVDEKLSSVVLWFVDNYTRLNFDLASHAIEHENIDVVGHLYRANYPFTEEQMKMFLEQMREFDRPN